MKKLMILGGHYYLLPVIERAHELGIYVITVDYLPNNTAHSYSDEYHNVSIIDKDAVLELAKRLNINGIISFANDLGVTTAAYVAEQMQLPFQCSYESTCILQDKGRFRSFLQSNGFRCPKSKRYIDKAAPLNDIDFFAWPVIVKPTDSCGSNGVTRVDDPKDLPDAIEFAVASSHGGAFIIEEYISIKPYRSDADMFTIEGKLAFAAFSNQMFNPQYENPYAPANIAFPSTTDKQNQAYLIKELQRLMTLLKMKNGIYNVETCVSQDGKPYIMEVSPRGGGNRISQLLKHAYGIDLIEYEIRQAVDMDLPKMSPSLCNGVWDVMVICPLKGTEGIYKGYEIDESVKQKYIKYVDMFAQEGDLIVSTPGKNHVLGNLFVRTDNHEELECLIETRTQWMKLIIEKEV